MKINLIFFLVVFGIVFSACSSHENNFYDRANNASEKSLESLERDKK